MKRIALLLVVVAACSKSKSGGAEGDPCETSIGKAIDAMMSSRKGSPEMVEQMKTISEQLRTIMVGACKLDHWPAEVLQCFQAATDQPSIKKCRGMLPPEQAQHLQAEILKVMSGAGRCPGRGPRFAGPRRCGSPSAVTPHRSENTTTPSPSRMCPLSRATSGCHTPDDDALPRRYPPQ